MIEFSPITIGLFFVPCLMIAPVPMYNTFEDVARFYDVLLNMVYRYDVFEE